MKFSNKPNNFYKELRSSVKEGEVLVVPIDDRLLEESAPYVAGGKNLPAWFKNTPKEGIRNCAGVQDYLNAGFILPAWTTFSFVPRNDGGGWDLDIGQLPYSLEPFVSEPFPIESTGRCPMSQIRELKDSPYPKLVNPYMFVTAPGWSLQITGIAHEPNPNYDVVPAIVHTDYYHNMNVVLNLRSNQPFRIPYGEPLAHFIPFKREGNIEKLHFATENEYKYFVGRGVGKGQIRDSAERIGRAYRRGRRNSG